MINKVNKYPPLFIGLITFLISSNSYSFNDNQNSIKMVEPKYLLAVNVNKIKSIRGYLFYQLLSCEIETQQANHKLIKTKEKDHSGSLEQLPLIMGGEVKVLNSQMPIFTHSISQGSYAIRIFQDMNNNKELDMSSNAIPLEPIGFSNNPIVAFGAPKMSDVCFEFAMDKTIDIKLKNKRKRKRARRR